MDRQEILQNIGGKIKGGRKFRGLERRDQYTLKGGYTLVTLPHIVTPYRDSVDGTRDRVTLSKVGYTVTLRACSVCCRYLAVSYL